MQVIAGIISKNTPKHSISRKKTINWVRILPNQHHTGHGQCSLSQRKLFSFQSKEGSGGKRWTHKCKAKCVSSPRFFRIQVLLEALWPVVDLFLGRQRGSLLREFPLSVFSDERNRCFQRKVIPSWFYNFNAKWVQVNFTTPISGTKPMEALVQ